MTTVHAFMAYRVATPPTKSNVHPQCLSAQLSQHTFVLMVFFFIVRRWNWNKRLEIEQEDIGQEDSEGSLQARGWRPELPCQLTGNRWQARTSRSPWALIRCLYFSPTPMLGFGFLAFSSFFRRKCQYAFFFSQISFFPHQTFHLS